MLKQAPLFVILAIILIGPIALRPKDEAKRPALPGERALVVITPHVEAIRYEFGRAFETHYLAKTGQRVHVDYRTPGGTSEIARYVASEYLAAFENHWRNTLRREWSGTVAASFDNAKVALNDT